MQGHAHCASECSHPQASFTHIASIGAYRRSLGSWGNWRTSVKHNGATPHWLASRSLDIAPKSFPGGWLAWRPRPRPTNFDQVWPAVWPSVVKFGQHLARATGQNGRSRPILAVEHFRHLSSVVERETANIDLLAKCRAANAGLVARNTDESDFGLPSGSPLWATCCTFLLEFHNHQSFAAPSWAIFVSFLFFVFLFKAVGPCGGERAWSGAV